MTGIAWFAALLFLSAAPLVLAVPFLLRRYPRLGLLRLLIAVSAGFFAVLPALLVQAALPRLSSGAFNMALHAFMIIALTEEGAKFVTLRLFRSRWGASGIAIPACVAASLGFAFFETVVYASVNPSVLLIRAVTAAPLHAACGSWVGRAALETSAGGPIGVMYFAFAVLVHGAYDLGLLVPGFPIVVPILIALLGLALALHPLKGSPDREN